MGIMAVPAPWELPGGLNEMAAAGRAPGTSSVVSDLDNNALYLLSSSPPRSPSPWCGRRNRNAQEVPPCLAAGGQGTRTAVQRGRMGHVAVQRGLPSPPAPPPAPPLRISGGVSPEWGLGRQNYLSSFQKLSSAARLQASFWLFCFWDFLMFWVFFS